jgi:EAL domain-containing protein (putative c-di-GMP-specific phosphodiesterase class I)
LFLQYQPKVHLRRQQIVSVEALVRWNHPERGLVLPSDFIPSAEESRHIGPLTLWTLRQVIADQRALAAQGHDIPVFINISGVLLGDQPFVDEACRLVQTGGAKIGFEITETSVIRDPDSAIANLNAFANIGIPIAIDDYGAGLSSLAYLKRLPASELKIDKLFVTQLTSSNRDPLIVRSTIDLAHALEMEVTAEGVESPAALALLSVMGCDMAQGFLISRPIAFDALVQYLGEEHHLAATSEKPGFGGLAAAWKRA